mgnify:CR=1 FL=1
MVVVDRDKPTGRVLYANRAARAGRIVPGMRYAAALAGDEDWQNLPVPTGDLFQWDLDSTYVREAPYFDGFKDEPDVPLALKLLQKHGVQIDDMETSYFLSRDIVIPTIGSGMMPWREKLFAGMHRNASGVADFLSLPTNRVVELGTRVQL